MKVHKTPALILSALLLAPGAFSRAAEEPLLRNPGNESVRNEVLTAINRGLEFIKSKQAENGAWSNQDHPALTALPMVAFLNEPTRKYRNGKKPEFLEKAAGFVRSHAKPDGSIYNFGLSNYNTSVAMMALLLMEDPKDKEIIEKARAFVVGQQATGMAKSATDGGIGYGTTGVSPKRSHPDLDNTLISLEALRLYRSMHPEQEVPKEKDLNWQAAIEFITRCQNLPSHNKEPWASDDAKNKGGFIYYPGFSNANKGEQETLPDGKKAWRSYGTMTYAGMLSLLYADVKKDDPRVQAAVDWLKRNYTLEENPGMGKEGRFYYYQLMAKGLSAAGLEQLETADGKKVNWPRDLALKLINSQSGDGHWVNDVGRWMENDPVLVTTYCVIALERIYGML